MNKNNAAQFLPLVQALAEGKTIQYNDNGTWCDMHGDSIAFGNLPGHYRVKPEAREWKGKISDTRWNSDGIAEFTIIFRGEIDQLPKVGETIRVREIID